VANSVEIVGVRAIKIRYFSTEKKIVIKLLAC
jgi:hypothetical protein